MLIYLGFGVSWLFSGNLIVGKANKDYAFEPFSKKYTYTLFCNLAQKLIIIHSKQFKKIISRESSPIFGIGNLEKKIAHS